MSRQPAGEQVEAEAGDEVVDTHERRHECDDRPHQRAGDDGGQHGEPERACRGGGEIGSECTGQHGALDAHVPDAGTLGDQFAKC